MKPFFDSDLELVVESDFIYLPLLFDPDMEKEIRAISPPENKIENSNGYESKAVIKIKDKYFVKGFRPESLIKNYKSIDPYVYHHLKNECLRKYQLTREGDGIFLDEMLKTILFQVMPHFIRKHKGLNRKKLSDEDMLDLIGHKIDIPDSYFQEAKTFQDLTSMAPSGAAGSSSARSTRSASTRRRPTWTFA
ncbi:MAG: hypothetical protein P8012_11960, partial [Desulfobacterales bacterium]